jgi:hypothetical protein
MSNMKSLSANGYGSFCTPDLTFTFTFRIHNTHFFVNQYFVKKIEQGKNNMLYIVIINHDCTNKCIEN